MLKNSKSESVSVGFSDHNLVAVARKLRVPKVGPRVLHQRSFRSFYESDFIRDIKRVQWGRVGAINNVEKALQLFIVLLLEATDKHAPIRKFTVKARKPSWLDDEQKALMAQMDRKKKVAIKSGDAADWKSCCLVRN